jgi:glutamyl-tRNA reductase
VVAHTHRFSEKGTPVLVAVGLNQKGATVSDRELLALSADGLGVALAGYAALGGIDEVAVLSTCNRVEVFASTTCPAAASLALRQALAARAGREVPLFELHADAAFRHLVRVAASLESAIVGEPQILGQVKAAFQRAIDAGVAGKELTSALNRTLEIAKRIRTETTVGRAGVSWGHAAAALAEKVLGPLEGRRVTVVGAGEMARLSAQHLAEQGATLAILNRTLAHAEALAAEVGGTAHTLDALEAELLRADVVVSAAPIAPAAFRPEAMAAAAKARRRPLVMVDLAVPRAIPPETGAVRDVYLCDVDDLGRVMTAALDQRSAAAAHAERIIDEEMTRWAREQAERRAAPLIREIRSRASAIAREEVERTLRRVGKDPELARRLDAMAGSIVSKLLHEPSTRLRQAVAAGGDGEALLSAAALIFDLPGEGSPRTNVA